MPEPQHPLPVSTAFSGVLLVDDGHGGEIEVPVQWLNFTNQPHRSDDLGGGITIDQVVLKVVGARMMAHRPRPDDGFDIFPVANVDFRDPVDGQGRFFEFNCAEAATGIHGELDLRRLR